MNPLACTDYGCWRELDDGWFEKISFEFGMEVKRLLFCYYTGWASPGISLVFFRLLLLISKSLDEVLSFHIVGLEAEGGGSYGA